MKRRRGRGPFLVGAGVTGLVLAVALLAPLIAPYPVDLAEAGAVLAPPSAAHWLGTDEDGFDLLTQVLYGARVAVLVGVLTVLLSALLGTAVGLVAGYFGGWLDDLLMRLTEVVLSFPGILLAILLQAVWRQPGLWSVVLALSATGWAGYARLARGQTMQVRELDFVHAARALGVPAPRILLRHVLPNIAAPLLVQATFGVAGAVLAEASLSFLGLGPQGLPSWGALLEQGAVLFTKSPWVALCSGLAIVVTVLGINFLGDAVRDRLDPQA